MNLEKCRHCKEGLIPVGIVYRSKDYTYFKKCIVCQGKGKVDWIRNITGDYDEWFVDFNPAGSLIFGKNIPESSTNMIFDGREYIDINSEKGKALYYFFL